MTDTINTTPQGTGNTQYTPEDLAIQYSDSTVVQQLGQLAETLAEQDSLTSSEKKELEAMANASMPTLSPADQTQLSNWLQVLAAYPASTSTSTQDITDPSVTPTPSILDTTPPSNPFLQPGIMAILAPILSKLLPIMNQIIRQNSVLDQALIGLSQDMAEAACNLAIDAGKQKVQQLKAQVDQYISLAVNSALQGGATIGLSVYNWRQEVALEATKPQEDDLLYTEGADDPEYAKALTNWAAKQSPTPTGMPVQQANQTDEDYLTALKEWAAKQSPPTPGMPTLNDLAYPGGANSPEYIADLQDWKSTAYTKNQQLYQKQQTLSQFSQSAFSATSSSIQAGWTAAQEDATTKEATDTALSNYLSSMAQIIQQSMQKAVDDEKSANDSLKGLFQLYDQVSGAVTRAFYHG